MTEGTGFQEKTLASAHVGNKFRQLAKSIHFNDATAVDEIGIPLMI